jgi:hypothetical protein
MLELDRNGAVKRLLKILMFILLVRPMLGLSKARIENAQPVEFLGRAVQAFGPELAIVPIPLRNFVPLDSTLCIQLLTVGFVKAGVAPSEVKTSRW